MSQIEQYEVPRSERQWRKLLAFLPAFEDPESDPGGRAGGELTESGARTMPYVDEQQWPALRLWLIDVAAPFQRAVQPSVDALRS